MKIKIMVKKEVDTDTIVEKLEGITKHLEGGKVKDAVVEAIETINELSKTAESVSSGYKCYGRFEWEDCAACPLKDECKTRTEEDETYFYSLLNLLGIEIAEYTGYSKERYSVREDIRNGIRSLKVHAKDVFVLCKYINNVVGSDEDIQPGKSVGEYLQAIRRMIEKFERDA